MVSLGNDGVTLGRRNSPSLNYARFSPEFAKTKDGNFIGGQFCDGRANNLQHQAPCWTRARWGLKSRKVTDTNFGKEDYIAQISLMENQRYKMRNRPAVTDPCSLSKSKIFAPFSSKYDRFLRGEVALTQTEELGRLLFFSQQFTNCNQCHQLQSIPGAKMETFLIIATIILAFPRIQSLPNISRNVATNPTDLGLYANPNVNAPTMRGKFKTPTLRNIAVTGPYIMGI